MPHKAKSILLAGVTGLVKSRKIGCNTLELEYANGNKAVRYHNTDVITTYPNGDVTLTSGGWRTSTTKERLNSKYSVWSDKGIWYIKEPATAKVIPFFDGVTFDAAGNLKGQTHVVDFNKIKDIKKKIAKYVKLVDTLNPIPMPDGGDCWYCLMTTQSGETLGDISKNSDHLESHLEEGYIFGSIIFNALKEKGYPHPALIMQMRCVTSIKAALRRYLTKRLLPEVQAA
jgi:hypothetical protein